MRGLIDRYYAENGNRPIAYIDETYDVDPAHSRNFYAVTAVIVDDDQRDALRSGLVDREASGYWHTSEALRHANGRERAHELWIISPMTPGASAAL